MKTGKSVRMKGRRGRWNVMLLTVLALVLGTSFLPQALAVHNTGSFELDGNATNGPAPGDDWDNVCHQVRGTDCSTTSNTSGATSTSWTADGAQVNGGNLNASIFTGGGSKDPQDISKWAWKDDAGGLPAKDNLMHSFASRYTTNEGDVLFFGSDRYDNSGDAQQGFWFFQNKISLGSNSLNGGTGFTGLHKNGDVLVISDFSIGGSVSTISVLKWDTTCTKAFSSNLVVGKCGDANLRTLSTSTTANCANPSPDVACGIVNTAAAVAPWPFLDKSSGNTSSYAQGEFFEGGVNLTSLGVGNECFASVASETRSSTSTTATLKDFVLGSFANCGASLKTTPSTTSLQVGGSLTDAAKVSVAGTASPPAPTGPVDFYVCGPSSGISDCTTAGAKFDSVNLSNATKSGNDYTVTSGSYTPTAAGDYCFAANWAGDTNYPSGGSDGSSTECFTVTPVQPGVTTSQTAGPLPLGSTIKDTANLTGTANQPNGSAAGGTVTFTAYGPQADPNNPVCTGTPVYTSTGYAVSGDGTYPTAQQADASFVPTSAGQYNWVATYSGDSPNTLGVVSNCADEASVVISLQPTMDTHQSFYPNDSARVQVPTGAGNLTGNVRFTLFDNAACSGTPLLDSGNIDITGGSGSGLDRTVSTNNTTVKVDQNASLSWLVTYSSTNSGIAINNGGTYVQHPVGDEVSPL